MTHTNKGLVSGILHPLFHEIIAHSGYLLEQNVIYALFSQKTTSVTIYPQLR